MLLLKIICLYFTQNIIDGPHMTDELKKAIWNEIEIESVESNCESFIDLLAYDFVTACNEQTNNV